MTVLPWPGETAWTAPRTNATSSEPSRAIGVRSLTASSREISSWTPPGMAPVTILGAGAGVGGGVAATGALDGGRRRGRGAGAGATEAGRAGGDARNSATRTSSGDASRSVG